MRIRLFWLLVGLGIMLSFAACTSPTSAPTNVPTLAQATAILPTTVPTIPPTVAPSPTPMPKSDNCIACHTNKETLEKLAEKKADKSEETAGEG